MITLVDYRKVLDVFAKDNIFSCSVASLNKNSIVSQLFIKHDVEANINRAVRMAEVEYKLGHVTTYYFQGDFIETKSGKKAIKKIASYGHEIAYHYDVLDANNGDYIKSTAQFKYYLDKFSSLRYRIKTVCPHGNPTKNRNGWNSNKDFFRNKKIRNLFPKIIDIVVDFPQIFTKGLYISDAAYKLRIITEIANNDQSNDSAMLDGIIIQWKDLNKLVKEQNATVLSIHPHRIMNNNFTLILQKIIFRIAKKSYIVLRKIPFISTIVSKFYKLSRLI